MNLQTCTSAGAKRSGRKRGNDRDGKDHQKKYFSCYSHVVWNKKNSLVKESTTELVAEGGRNGGINGRIWA